MEHLQMQMIEGKIPGGTMHPSRAIIQKKTIRADLGATITGPTAAAAGAPAIGGTNGAPASQPAPTAEVNADTATSTTPASLKVNGNSPAQWPLGAAWNDNLGALFTHGGQSETVYSTSTIDTSVAGTSTVDYWAEVPSTEHWLHTTRNVVVSAPTTAAPIKTANDNAPLTPLSATGTEATSTAQ
jgi:hypothetical protein